ncbi:MAG: SpoIID/LytB domain-containing protein [Candidatus Sericytochromatia bacterium]|nr:SpoIID/LytB domain-containing protein [Candidatus Sericytochromatia bacterium]
MLSRSALLGLVLFSTATGAAEAMPAELRVGVLDGVSRAVVAASTPAQIFNAQGQAIGKMDALQGWSASVQAGQVRLQGPRGQAVTLGQVGYIIGTAAENTVPLVFAGPRWYRGNLELRAGNTGLVVINRTDLENYLNGVVPSEMSATWPMEALSCQAIAARSYALANLNKHGRRGYDVCDTDECQVYRGVGIEAASTNQAVAGTRGIVLMQNGRVLPAFFHASSGGYTENSEDVWIQKLDHIRAVPDYDQNSPHFTWYKNVPAATLANRLANRGVRVGGLRELQPVSRSYSGRVRTVRVVGTLGTATISGETLRTAAGLASTLFNLAPRGHANGKPTEFAFAGRGWGHGLGMSQWGARRLAEGGYSASQILSHYYPGATLQPAP